VLSQRHRRGFSLTFPSAAADYGNFTLLHADSTPGALQVFLRDPAGPTLEGDERGTWIDADPVEDAFVVNVGEMVEVYSAGLYKATLHRVVHKSPTYRVSIPFFFEPTLEARIEVRPPPGVPCVSLTCPD